MGRPSRVRLMRTQFPRRSRIVRILSGCVVAPRAVRTPNRFSGRARVAVGVLRVAKVGVGGGGIVVGNTGSKVEVARDRTSAVGVRAAGVGRSSNRQPARSMARAVKQV